MMDVLHRIADPRGIVEILECAFPVVPILDIEDAGRSTPGTHVDSPARQIQVMTRILTEKHHVTAGFLDGFEDQFTREQQPLVFGMASACGANLVDHGWGCLAQSQRLQQ